MFYQKKDVEKFIIPGGTKGFIYPSSPKGDQTIALIEANGVYPEKGYSINDYCTETIILISGCLEIAVNENKFVLKNQGDILRILPNSKYSVKGKGMAIVSISPNWDSKQNHIIV